MEKNKVFDTDLNSLMGDFTPIDVDAVGESGPHNEIIIPEPGEKKDIKKEETPEEDNLIDLESDEEVKEEEELEDIQEEPSSKQSPHKDNSTTSSPLTPYAKLLVDEGILPNLDIKKFDGTADSLKEAMVNEIIGAVEMYKETLPDRVKQLINNYEEGVPFDKLLELDRSEIEVSEVTEDKLKDDTELQKKLVRSYLTKTTKFSETKINRTIEDYEDKDELQDEAISSLAELKSLVTKDKEQEKLLIKEQEKRIEAERKASISKLEDTINTTNEIIPGLKLNKKIKETVLQSMTVPAGYDKSGAPVNRIVAKRMEDPMGFELKLHYLFEITKGFTDFTRLAEKGKRDATKEFEASIQTLDKSDDGEGSAITTTKNTSFLKGLSKTFDIK
jgi:hypothetical protein